MIERGLLPDFSPAVLAELDRLALPELADSGVATPRDLRHLLWASIDNDDSRDLDQLTVAEALPDGNVRILVALADVDTLVKGGSAIDAHARHNTTSVYTAARVFPMLPEEISTGLTSLNPDEDRLAIVIEMAVHADGSVGSSEVYQAVVRNKAQLAYKSMAAWLDGEGEMPEALLAVSGLAENLRLQDAAAQEMKNFRHVHGALSFETIEAVPRFEADRISALEWDKKSSARELIEDFMIAANGVVARYLESRNYPSIRRVVRTPKRWPRIVELAADHGDRLPPDPDAQALEAFLSRQKAADPLRFPDVSLAVIKLMGAGEYVADPPGGEAPGHFGLAVKDYTHSTAPNRRYTDLVTHRLVKAALEDGTSPYDLAELEALARHCTEQEDAASKVERQVGKSAAALLLESRIGERFDAIVTGASEKGTWVRLLSMPVEGKLVRGYERLDVGYHVRVQLVDVDVEKGYIDFKKIG